MQKKLLINNYYFCEPSGTSKRGNHLHYTTLSPSCMR